MDRKQRTVPAGEFRAKCLALLDAVRDRHEEIIVTKRGKPVAKLVPIDAPDRPSLGHMVRFMGDVVSPIDVEWEAERPPIPDLRQLIRVVGDIESPINEAWEADH